MSVSRTNIDIDDELIATVMKQNALTTKREAVDFALRKVVRPTFTREQMLALQGSMTLENYERLMTGDEERFRMFREAMAKADPERIRELADRLERSVERSRTG